MRTLRRVSGFRAPLCDYWIVLTGPARTENGVVRLPLMLEPYQTKFMFIGKSIERSVEK